MPDMFDNLRERGSITKGDVNEKDKRNFVAGIFTSKCSQCKNEPATGSIRMDDNKWYKVGNACRRTMGTKGRKGQQSQ